MAKEYAKKFYKSVAWRKCRDAYFASQFGLCEGDKCNNPGKIVHHVEYITPENISDPNITLNFDNLELLCQDCHNREHHGSGEEVVRDGLEFNQYGELVEVVDTPPIK
ncbi:MULTISPECIES: HNH endonuclease [Bacillaceae]|uniref:HNH endonuclease n=1 Tax=Evansella alkalicola TaxID=745819 RepID=A0ABS6K0G1_9BACI|nr:MULTISPECIES: HNH endonuclease [Bacillaceae]MBU9724135.1 HNH endonuclease [Bacillus alkalicola]